MKYPDENRWWLRYMAFVVISLQELKAWLIAQTPLKFSNFKMTTSEITLGSTVFARWRQRAPHPLHPNQHLTIPVLPPAESLWVYRLPDTSGPAYFALKIAHSCVGIWTPSNAWFLGPPVHTQMVSWSVIQFSCFYRAHNHYTPRDRQTTLLCL